MPALFPDADAQTIEETVAWFSTLGLYKADGSAKAAVSVVKKAFAASH